MLYLSILALFGADPSDLKAALESADKVEVRFVETGGLITLNREDAKSLAQRLVFNEDAREIAPDERVATRHIFVIATEKGEFLLIGRNTVRAKRTERTLVDSSFRDALYKRFVPDERKSVPAVIQTVDADSPTALRVHKLGLLATTRDSLHLFTRSQPLGKLLLTKTYRDEGLTLPVALVENGKYIYVIGYSILVYRAGETFQLVQTTRDDNYSEPSGAAISPDGRHLYVCLRSKRLLVYEVENNGKLIQVQAVSDDSLNRPTGVATSADGNYLYVCCHGPARTNAICVFARDNTSGELRFVTAEIDELTDSGIKPEDRGLTFASAMARVENRLYVAGLAGKLSLWETKGERLSFVKQWSDRVEGYHALNGAKSIVAGPDGRLWVAAEKDEAVSWFDRKNERGLLTFGGKIDQLKGVRVVAVSPDGKTVYAGGVGKIWVIATDPKAGRSLLPGQP